VGWVVTSHPGSALRFSQPLSGFGTSEFCDLVSCRNRSWDPPYRAFPSQQALHPSRGSLLPCRCPPACKDVLFDALSLLVSPTSTPLAQSPGSPSSYGSPFRCQIDHFPVALDPEQRDRLLPPASPTSKPCSSCESVRVDRSCPHPTAVTLLTLRPPEPNPSRLRACSRPGPKTRTPTVARRLWSATRRTSRPSAPGETSPTPKCRASLVGGYRPLSRPPAPPLSGAPAPSTFLPPRWPKPSRRSLALGALKYV